MAKVSIVAPVYNVEKYINQFLDSIKAQTFQDIEVILIDDGSNDNCPEILDKFAAEDDRYHVIHQSNRGVASARNVGLTYVSGEYVYIVDSDDWLEPTAIENLYYEVELNSPDIIYGDYIEEKEDKSVRHRYFTNEFYTTDEKTIHALQFAVNANGKSIKFPRPEFNIINGLGGAPWRCMIKTCIIKEHDIQYDSYVGGLGDDILFTLNTYEYVKSVSYIPCIIYHYRKLRSTYSHGYKEDYLDTIGRILEKQEEFIEQVRERNKKLLWQSFYMRVLIYTQQGMDRYFLNALNPKSEHELFTIFKHLMKISPYNNARLNFNIRFINSKRTALSFLLLKLGQFKLYWELKKFIKTSDN